MNKKWLLSLFILLFFSLSAAFAQPETLKEQDSPSGAFRISSKNDELKYRVMNLENALLVLKKQNLSLINQNKGLKEEKNNLYAEINNLEGANSKLESEIEKGYAEAKNRQQAKKRLWFLSKAKVKLNSRAVAFKEQNQRMREKITLLGESFKKEKAFLYQELGTVYTQVKLFNLAMDAYKKSLSLNPGNAEVNYNLGLLCKHYSQDSKEAVKYLKNYLELSPRAENKKDVEYLIRMLSEPKMR